MDDSKLVALMNAVNPVMRAQIQGAAYNGPSGLELAIQGSLSATEITLLVGLQGNFPLLGSIVSIFIVR